jgi:hypothetical protein
MLSDAQHEVGTMIALDVPFDQIEAHIDTLPRDHEQRSALWLLAWVTATSPAAREHAITQTPDRVQ